MVQTFSAKNSFSPLSAVSLPIYFDLNSFKCLLVIIFNTCLLHGTFLITEPTHLQKLS
jgi:hypothetical protein